MSIGSNPDQPMVERDPAEIEIIALPGSVNLHLFWPEDNQHIGVPLTPDIARRVAFSIEEASRQSLGARGRGERR